MTRFWIIIVVVTFVVLVLVFVGAASIVNARLLAKSTVTSRYKHLFSESVVVDHVHEVHVQRRFMFGELKGFSDDRSYVQVGVLRIPISSDERIGWMFIAMGLVCITVWVPRLIRFRNSLAGGG